MSRKWRKACERNVDRMCATVHRIAVPPLFRCGARGCLGMHTALVVYTLLLYCYNNYKHLRVNEQMKD